MGEEDETMNVSAILQGVRNWRDDRLTNHMLARLSDRDLADIGLSRSDIDPGLTGDAERARRVDRYSRW